MRQEGFRREQVEFGSSDFMQCLLPQLISFSKQEFTIVSNMEIAREKGRQANLLSVLLPKVVDTER